MRQVELRGVNHKEEFVRKIEEAARSKSDPDFHLTNSEITHIPVAL